MSTGSTTTAGSLALAVIVQSDSSDESTINSRGFASSQFSVISLGTGLNKVVLSTFSGIVLVNEGGSDPLSLKNTCTSDEDSRVDNSGTGALTSNRYANTDDEFVSSVSR